jgi:mono/diheme cytochrome c family protein
VIEALYRFLRSVGFNDPIHAPVVHAPIGLVIGALVFFAVALLFKRRQLVLTARHVSILALVFVFPSVLFGVVDWLHFYHGAMIPAILAKIGLAAVLTLLLAAGIVFGGRAKPVDAAMLVIYIFSFFAVVGLGYFGGGLVYGQGPAAVSGKGAAGASALPAGYEAGKALFADNCQACHQGGGNSIVASLPVKGSKKLASLDAFEKFLRAPAMPDGKGGDMPAYGADALAAGQLKDLYAFVGADFGK